MGETKWGEPTKTDRAGELATVPLPVHDTTGYLILAMEIDGHSGPPSDTKQRLLRDLKGRASQLRHDMFANVLIFSAMHMRRSENGAPRFDIVVLIQAPTVESAHWLKGDPAFAALYKRVLESARATRVLVTFNMRRNACEYGPRLPRIYVLMRYAAGDRRDVVPGWGWTYRRHLVSDLLFNRALRRYLSPGGISPPARSVLYRLA